MHSFGRNCKIFRKKRSFKWKNGFSFIRKILQSEPTKECLFWKNAVKNCQFTVKLFQKSHLLWNDRQPFYMTISYVDIWLCYDSCNKPFGKTSEIGWKQRSSALEHCTSSYSKPLHPYCSEQIRLLEETHDPRHSVHSDQVAYRKNVLYSWS